MRQTVFGQVNAADPLMKLTWLSDFVCGGLRVAGSLYLLFLVFAGLLCLRALFWRVYA